MKLTISTNSLSCHCLFDTVSLLTSRDAQTSRFMIFLMQMEIFLLSYPLVHSAVHAIA